MITIEKLTNKIKVTVNAEKMGNDWNVSIYGGEKPHIGAVAIGIPRKSLADNEKISSSVSVITVTGHKEDDLVVPIAKKLSSHCNSIVVVTGGIHIDNITKEEIVEVMETINKCIDEIIEKI